TGETVRIGRDEQRHVLVTARCGTRLTSAASCSHSDRERLNKRSHLPVIAPRGETCTTAIPTIRSCRPGWIPCPVTAAVISARRDPISPSGRWVASLRTCH
ncbi:MAG: hypothetical protein ACRDTZ_24495, partial [Pseudonocardiaceae bacterium]